MLQHRPVFGVHKSGTEGGVIHVWDIMNAKKVAFTLPVEGVSVSVESHKEDEWLLRQVMQHSNDPHYFCLILKSKLFPKQVLRTSHFRIKRFYTSLTSLLLQQLIAKNQANIILFVLFMT